MKKKLLLIGLGIMAFSLTSVHAQTAKAGLDFDGNNDIIRIPHNSNLNFGTGAFTIELWIQADASQAFNPHLLHKKDTITNATGFALSLTNKGKIGMEIKGIGYSTGSGSGSGSDLRDGQCHHIAIHRDLSGTSDTIRIFVDGSLLKKSVKAMPSEDISEPVDLHIGWVSGGFGKTDFPYKGMIKEVRFWNVARSESEIDDKKDEFLKGNESGLIGYWTMNENSGTTVRDHSSGNNDGIIVSGNGAPAWKDFCDVMTGSLPGGQVGISEQITSKGFIYPNPAKDEINFIVESGQTIASVNIYNAMGSLVKTESLSTNKMNIASLNAGVYFYELNLSDNTVVKNRFIKE